MTEIYYDYSLVGIDKDIVYHSRILVRIGNVSSFFPVPRQDSEDTPHYGTLMRDALRCMANDIDCKLGYLNEFVLLDKNGMTFKHAV